MVAIANQQLAMDKAAEEEATTVLHLAMATARAHEDTTDVN